MINYILLILLLFCSGMKVCKWNFWRICWYYSERKIYDYKEGEIEQSLSFGLEHIEETTYFINEEPVTEEEYNKVKERYQRLFK